VVVDQELGTAVVEVEQVVIDFQTEQHREVFVLVLHL
jgi:hypothetical protein